jgi:hypothetical protein
MKKLLLILLLALPLAAGLAGTMIWSITAAYADPPDPNRKP